MSYEDALALLQQGKELIHYPKYDSWYIGNNEIRKDTATKLLDNAVELSSETAYRTVYRIKEQLPTPNEFKKDNDLNEPKFTSTHYQETLIDFTALMQLKLAEFEDTIAVPSEKYTAEQGYKAGDYDSQFEAWITERLEFIDSLPEIIREWAKLAEGKHMSGFTHGCVSTLLDLANLFDAINALEPKGTTKEK